MICNSGSGKTQLSGPNTIHVIAPTSDYHSNTKIKTETSPFKRKKQKHLSDDIRRSSQQTSPNSLFHKNNNTSS